MKDLLSNYSVEQILLFIVLLAAAIKGVVSWVDWARGRGEKVIEKRKKQDTLQESVNALIKAQENMKNDINSCQMQLKETINDIKSTVNILKESDKDDIKAWITEKHDYFVYQIGYIDNFSLQCIEARYKHYKDEDGNTFIDGFMDEIRKLPIKSSVYISKEEK